MGTLRTVVMRVSTTASREERKRGMRGRRRKMRRRIFVNVNLSPALSGRIGSISSTATGGLPMRNAKGSSEFQTKFGVYKHAPPNRSGTQTSQSNSLENLSAMILQFTKGKPKMSVRRRMARVLLPPSLR